MQSYAAQILHGLSTTFKEYYQSSPQIEGNVIDLALGEIRLEYPEWLTNTIAHSSGHAPLGYVSTQGLLSLRQSYARLLQEQGYRVDESNILVTAGGKEALWTTLM